MIKFENTVMPSADQWKAIIFGARNPLNSWDRSDSFICEDDGGGECNGFDIGLNDWNLLWRLRKAGTDHRKFMRMITVYTDITAPLYWWKEFDTYKVGTVANSCSTMHKIHEKEFELEDFSHEHLCNQWEDAGTFRYCLQTVIAHLNKAREKYHKTGAKGYWWQMIQLLPTSYNQKRTVMLNYEVLANMYKSRKNHKLDEWHHFCDWIKALPYSELITGEFDKEN